MGIAYDVLGGEIFTMHFFFIAKVFLLYINFHPYLILVFTFPLFLFYIIYYAEVFYWGWVFSTEAVLAVIVIVAGFDITLIVDAGEGAAFSIFFAVRAKI